MPTSAAFQKAASDVTKFEAEPPGEDRLKVRYHPNCQLYALFKIAHGTSFADAKKPGTFDLQGKYKYNAWKEMADKGVTPTQAQQQYVKFVDELRPKYEKK
ncbi:hypothetical protein MMC18_006226 [Xylographa bjoerkii]|nr:hypothetical protein [Xylographa bjoerkii]